MESHEWFEKTDDAKVYYRANYIGGRWTIMTTTMKRNPVWEDLREVPAGVWRELRDIVFNKYQRKRLPWERVAEIDRILEAASSDHRTTNPPNHACLPLTRPPRPLVRTHRRSR